MSTRQGMRMVAVLMGVLTLHAAAGAAPANESATTRAAFLKLLDRPRVPLDAKESVSTTQPGVVTFSYMSEAGERVPGLMIMPAHATGRLPTVIVLHGTGGKKEGSVSYMKLLAARGMIGVSIDGRFHGERTKNADGTLAKGSDAYVAAILDAYRTPGPGKGHPFLYDTVWDVMRLVDYLSTRPDVDATRIGLMGISKGGMETYLAAAADERIAAAVPCIGVQSFAWGLEHEQWQARVSTFQAAADGAAKDAGKPLDAAFMRTFYARVVPGIDSTFDGPNMLPLIAPRPLLVINGELDPRNPLPGVELVAEKTRAAYAAAGAEDHFELLIEPHTGHAVTPDARDAAIAWFAKWLKPVTATP